MEENTVLSERLVELRDLFGVTDAQIGRALGTSEYFVRRWHSGESAPDLARFTQLCRYYGAPADYLLGLSSYLPFDMRERLLAQQSTVGFT